MTAHGDEQEHGSGQRPRGRQDPVGRRARRTRRTAGLSRRGRVLAVVAVVLTAGLVSGVLVAYSAYRGLFDKIHRIRVSHLGARPPGYGRSLNLLVIGSDTRHGRNRQFGAHITGQRSDTILVVHLSPGYRRVVVLSLPRDSVVPVLACPPAPGAPGQSASPGQVEQINQTFADGGPGCLWKTIEHATGIRLDHFLELNFTGFEHVINDLGGVSICLPYAISDPHSRLRLSRGLHHVTGAQALAYWRVRYIGVGSDLERIARDQYLMASVAQDVRRADLLGDPARLYQVMSDAAASLTTDTGLTQGMLISLAQGLRGVSLRAVRFVQAPVSVYQPNPDWVRWSPAAGTLFRAIARDRSLPQAAARHALRRHAQRARRDLGHGSPPGRHGSPPGRHSSPPGRHSTPPGRHSTPPGNRTSRLSGVARSDGGITAGANVCRDSGAFAGPLGGH